MKKTSLKGDPYALIRQAPLVSSFEINAGEGDDKMIGGTARTG